MAVLKTALCRAGQRPVPAVLLLRSCTQQQQGTQWLETDMAFLTRISVLYLRVGVSRRSGVVWACFPHAQPLCIVNMAAHLALVLQVWAGLRLTSTCVCTVLGM